MSADHSFASEIATAKILHQESIPSDVGNAPNFDQSELHAKLRAVPTAAVSRCSNLLDHIVGAGE
jgi:hypothetical protein